jgi:hypothetical protein
MIPAAMIPAILATAIAGVIGLYFAMKERRDARKVSHQSASHAPHAFRAAGQ